MELRDITADYGGHPILNGVSLRLEQGSTTGLLGRNGSGKTTLIHTAIGLKAPKSGKALLFGEPAWDASQNIRARLGFVPQVFYAYEWLAAVDAIAFVGDCYPNWDHNYVAALMNRWLPNSWEKISNLSPGQRQRVAALLAIGHKPDLLVLDEPVAAMDSAARHEFFAELVELRRDNNQTVLLSSHITSDIERYCSHVAILQAGKILLHEPLDELRQRVYCIDADKASAQAADFVLARTKTQLWLRDAPAHLLTGSEPQQLVLEDLFLALTL